MIIAPQKRTLCLIRMPQARGSLRQGSAVRCENWLVFFNIIVKKYRLQSAQINRRLWYLHLLDNGSSVIKNSFTSLVTVNRLLLPMLVLNKFEYQAEKQHDFCSYFTNLFTKLVTINHPDIPASALAVFTEAKKKDLVQLPIVHSFEPLMPHRPSGTASMIKSNTSANQYVALHRRDIKRTGQSPTTYSSSRALSHAKQQGSTSEKNRKKIGLDLRETTVKDFLGLHGIPLMIPSSLGHFDGGSLINTTRVIHADNIHTQSDPASGRVSSARTFPHLQQTFTGSLYENKLKSIKGGITEHSAPQFVFPQDRQTQEHSYYLDVYEKDKVVGQPVTDGTKTEFGQAEVGLIAPVLQTYLYQKYMKARHDTRNINMSCETRVNSLAQLKSFRKTSPTSSYSVFTNILTHKREEQYPFEFPVSTSETYLRPPAANPGRGLVSSSYGETNGNLVHLSNRGRIGSETTSGVHFTKKETTKNTVVETRAAPTISPISNPNVATGSRAQVRILANQVYDLIVERVRRERLLRGH